MNESGAGGGAWPTGDHELLLHAALADPDIALHAWKDWRARTGPDSSDLPSTRLLPMAYKNLGPRLGDEDADRLRNAYLQSWTRNQFLFRAAAPALAALANAGIRTLLLKGIPLSQLYYRDDGARPMWDCDVLVPWEDAYRALDVLVELGWTPERSVTDAILATEPGTSLRDRAGQSLDLHWHALHDHLFVEADDGFWRDAVDFTFRGVSTSTLSPERHVVHVIGHGFVWSPEIVTHWIPDIVHVVRLSGEQFDWDRAIRVADEYDLTSALADTVRYVSEQGFVNVPPPVTDSLRTFHPTLHERAEHYFRIHAEPKKIWGTLPRTWFRYRRQALHNGRSAGLIGFAQHLRKRWAIDSWATMGRRFLQKLGRQLRRVARR